MNTKPILHALNGGQSKSVPFWFMRQAGRYLPEYRELRAAKGGFLDLAFDPDAASEVTIQPLRRFGMDAAIIFSDILTIPMALGQHLEFVAGEGPKLGPLNIDALEYDPDILNPVYEALRQTRSKMAHEGFDDTALIGFAGAPWTVATYMVEGGSSKLFIDCKTMAYSNPDLFQTLINHIVDATADYLIKQVDAGSEILQIFDSWAGALDVQGFEKWSITPIAAIVKRVRAAHPDIPIIGFPKGAGGLYPRFVQETGVNAIQIDPLVSPDFAKDHLQPHVPVQGNLDPMRLQSGGDGMRRALDNILTLRDSGPYIFNLGHGIHKTTPISHVEAMVKHVREF